MSAIVHEPNEPRWRLEGIYSFMHLSFNSLTKCPAKLHSLFGQSTQVHCSLEWYEAGAGSWLTCCGPHSADLSIVFFVWVSGQPVDLGKNMAGALAFNTSTAAEHDIRQK